MTIDLQMPDSTDLSPKITVFGVGGAGGNAVNNMIQNGLEGVEFVVANTDAQALNSSQVKKTIQMGVVATEGLGAGSQPEIGRAAAEEALDVIKDHLHGSHMVFITAGMGGGTGTGAAPIVAQAARDLGILTVGVVTKPFNFEGARRMKIAEEGIITLQTNVDTLIVIPNQNLFRIANDQTTFADAFAMADQVLFSGVASVTDLMVKEGLINLDFADIRTVMRNMGNAMMGTGEASGDGRAKKAAEEAIANPLLDETSMKGARGLLISISGGHDLTLFEVDEAATSIRQEVDPEANVILGATFDESLDGIVRVSVVATGIDNVAELYGDSTQQNEVDYSAQVMDSTNELIDKDSASVPESTYEHLEKSLNSKDAVSSNVDPEVTISEYRHQSAKRNSHISGENIDSLNGSKDEESPAREPYIPPPAEETDENEVQIPPLEQFPAIAQREYHAKKNQIQIGTGHSEEREKLNSEGSSNKPKGLLRRIASSIGMGKEDKDSAKQKNQGKTDDDSNRSLKQKDANSSPQIAAKAKDVPYSSDPKVAVLETRLQKKAESDNKPANQVPNEQLDEDQLEIPAFLRRQSN